MNKQLYIDVRKALAPREVESSGRESRQVAPKGKCFIEPINDELRWVKWLNEDINNGLESHDLSAAVRVLLTKINEIISCLNKGG